MQDRGAGLVETAIAVVFLSIMFLGISEYGFAWRQATVVEKSVQVAGRAAGNGANGKFTDWETLKSLQASFGSSSNAVINEVIIYKSTTASGSMDPDCLTGSKIGVCNHYVASDLARPASQFGCDGAEPDTPWCPMSRNRHRRPFSDYVGVYVNATYSGITGLVPGGITITRTAVYALEPCAFGLPDC